MSKLVIAGLHVFVFLAVISLGDAIGQSNEDRISLEGQWRFTLDPYNQGLGEAWFNNIFSDSIYLPGTVDEGRKVINSEPPTNMRLYRPYKYIGIAWCQHDLDVPVKWKEKRIFLNLERVHWKSSVWINGKYLGSLENLSTPQVYELDNLTPGKHMLTIRVDNHYQHKLGKRFVGPNETDLGPNLLSEDSQTNWNGIVGDITLYATSSIAVQGLQIFPKTKEKSVHISGILSGVTENDLSQKSVILTVREKISKKVIAKHSVLIEKAGFTTDIQLGEDVKLWDEFAPFLYEINTEIEMEDGRRNQGKTVSFGMRTLEADGTVFRINGRKIFLRGTVDQSAFPITGYAPMDTAFWREYFQKLRSYGMNYVRFHSWTPPEACFEMADEAGFYLLAEGPFWAELNRANSVRNQFLKDEATQIMQAYANHPSFCFFDYGNEIIGTDVAAKEELLQHLLQMDDPRVLKGFTGSYEINNDELKNGNQFATAAIINGMQYRHLPDGFWGNVPASTDIDFTDAIASSPIPVIGHEIGEHMVYPNFDDIPKFTGVLKPSNFEIMQAQLDSHGLLDNAHDFVQSSGRTAVMLYKEDIEATLRTRGSPGFDMLSIEDNTGQGTSLVGVLNIFMESKGLITPEKWREFCSPTVPLLNFSKRAYITSDTFKASAQVAHFGPHDLMKVNVEWSLTDQKGRVIAKKRMLKTTDIATGEQTDLGEISTPLNKIKESGKATITLVIRDGKEKYVNSWDLWVYQAIEREDSQDVFIANEWNESVQAALNSGAKVLLMIHQDRIHHTSLYRPGLPFWSPIFWRDFGWLSTMEPFGALIDNKHPIFNLFPVDSHLTWQWWDVFGKEGSVYFDLSEIPVLKDVSPIVQPIDDFGRNHKLGSLFELNVGKGKLVVSGFELDDLSDKKIASHQLRHSILKYMRSDSFNPRVTISVEDCNKVLSDQKKNMKEKDEFKNA